MSAPTPLAVFIARAEARALLWRAGALNLADAFDELDAEAEVSGLTAAIGQSEVDVLVAAAFAAVCGPPVADGWAGWAEMAAEYHEKRGQHTLIAEIEPKHLAPLRDLLAESISLAHAMYEISAAHRAEWPVAKATLEATEYLIQQNDAARLRKWLAQHSERERVAILQHFELKQQRKGRSSHV